jgi:hypothetical protein
MSVPPWFSALQVPVHSTMQFAPEPHVTVDPPPAVTVQSLPDSQVMLAETPAVNVQVAWLKQSRFALSVAPMVQVALASHFVSQLEPQAPLHVAPPAQLKLQPLVWDVQAPVPLKLQAPLVVHEHEVPEQLAGTPVELLEPDEPQATEKQTNKLAKKALHPIMTRTSRRVRARGGSDAPSSSSRWTPSLNRQFYASRRGAGRVTTSCCRTICKGGPNGGRSTWTNVLFARLSLGRGTIRRPKPFGASRRTDREARGRRPVAGMVQAAVRHGHQQSE